MSKTRIWESPAADIIVRSLECGMNLTENILPRWKVSIWVLSEKPASAPYMLIRQSSLPEASSVPSRDHLWVASECWPAKEESAGTVLQGVHAAGVAV